MDAETCDLALFAALSLFCAGVAWTVDHVLKGPSIPPLASTTHWH
jgi:hypothetical protein